MIPIRQILLCLFLMSIRALFAGPPVEKVLDAMKKATCFMVEKVSTNGGYLWTYLPDLSRRWGEMEAYDSMIWVQPPGTTSMGHLFLDAYHITGDESYFRAAQKAARALIWGQLDCGGWNYMIDFAGDRSLVEWYNTIGKNGWRLEEFQHYYGNATFDDDVSSDAATFLLRMYLENLDPAYKYPLDRAIDFILKSQYPLGGWPQRYPLKQEFSHHGLPDYTSFYTFNDDVVWENINFLLTCYQTLGERRFLDPIRRGMNFYLITQQGPPQAGWGQQYTMDLKPSGARSYEPNALLPSHTFQHAKLLMKFYQLTGETKFLAGIPAAVDWLKSCALPPSMGENGRYTHPVFVEIGTNKPIFVHRKGSNVIFGFYYFDYDDARLLTHYGGKLSLDIPWLEKEYERVKNIPPDQATKGSVLVPQAHKGPLPQRQFKHAYSGIGRERVDDNTVRDVLAALDGQNRWLTKHDYTSHPYRGDGTRTEPTDAYATTFVGDETDTSPFKDTSGQEYISTAEYLSNMRLLLNYVSQMREQPPASKGKKP
jgi:PelA/Pel-15E family pectate lyase